jgi:hypothetical protein
LGLILEDGILDSDEGEAPLKILHIISGAFSEIGEFAKTSSLLIHHPRPRV